MAENKQRIQGVLAAMGWNESDFSLEPQALGSTNTSYLCTYRGERYVLRLGSEHPGLLAINRKAEEAALRMVSAIGCGAELVYYDGATGNMLTRYIEGREMTGKDFHDPQLLLQGIRQMQNLHQQKTDYRFDMYQDIERKLAAIRENGIPLHPDFEKAYACYCERRDRHPLETSPHIGLCHGDPFANNFVLDTAGNVHLLDYEYAGMSDVSPDVFDYVDYGHQHVEALLRFCRENDLTNGGIQMIIRCIWEHNGNDTLLYAESPAGAFTRGASLEEAIEKMPQEIRSFLEWQGKPVPANIKIEIAQEKASDVAICDADSDVLFESEKPPLTYREYEELKRLALKSARDFEKLYQSIPDQTKSCLPARKTFYGPVPRTAQEMYIHTKNVTAYYFGEIEVDAENGGNMLSAREAAFCKLEQQPDYLQNKIFAGSYGEDWTLRKVLRRFLWHDRIHAKALYRMACKTFPDASIPNIFCFPV